MSVSRRFMTEKITVWTEQSKGAGQYAARVWSRSEIKCTLIKGGKTQTDNTGAEFKPSNTVFSGVEIPRGAKVADGWVVSPQPTADAYTVRATDTYTPLGAALRDYVAYTG